MTVCQITGADLFVSNGVVAVVHNCLGEVRRSFTIWASEIPENVSRAVGRFPNVTVVNVVSEMKLPAWGVIMQQVHSAAPVDIIGFVTPSSFLAYVISCDDIAKVRELQRW